jgi:hypothetical protein
MSETVWWFIVAAVFVLAEFGHRAEGRKAATIQGAGGRAEAVRQVYAAIMQADPTPELLAVLRR